MCVCVTWERERACAPIPAFWSAVNLIMFSFYYGNSWCSQENYRLITVIMEILCFSVDINEL